jgi:hypothetical protein
VLAVGFLSNVIGVNVKEVVTVAVAVTVVVVELVLFEIVLDPEVVILVEVGTDLLGLLASLVTAVAVVVVVLAVGFSLGAAVVTGDFLLIINSTSSSSDNTLSF